MAKTYRACEFRLLLEDVDLDSVTPGSIYLTLDDRYRIGAELLVDRESGLVHITPEHSFEEDRCYKLAFAKRLRFEDGRPFPCMFFLRLCARDGLLYAPQDGRRLAPGEDFCTHENLLFHRSPIRVEFNARTGGLSVQSAPELDEPSGPDPDLEEAPVRGVDSSTWRVGPTARSAVSSVRTASAQRKRRGLGVFWLILLLLLLLAACLSLYSCRYYIWLPKKDLDYMPDLSGAITISGYAGIVHDDTIAELVSEAGGNTHGPLRASLLWNSGARNENDYDLICVEPDGTVIFFASPSDYSTGGVLDVDVIYPRWNEPAVENISWDSIGRMPEGVYSFYVCNYSERGGEGGFRAEIAYDGETFAFSYDEPMEERETVKLSDYRYSADTGFTKLP